MNKPIGQDSRGRLQLSMAVGHYDRIRPLVDGTIPIEGVSPVFLDLSPEETFFRAFRGEEFDLCELSLSSFAVRQAAGDDTYVGIPVFPSRMFRHTAFYVARDSAIRGPRDLIGKRVGLPEYQLTACVWARIVLAESGVDAADITWVRGGLEQAGRLEKIALDLPEAVSLVDAPEDKVLPELLLSGAIDAIISPRAPHGFGTADAPIRWLFDDPAAEARAYYGRTRIFPIMHLLGLKRELAQAHPWLPSSLFKAFTQAKDHALADLFATAASQISLPLMEETARDMVAMMGPDLWPYGVEANAHVLDSFLGQHFAQGLSKRRLAVDELFHPATRVQFKI